MGRELSDRNRRWLTGELADWETVGIISPEQSGQILSYYVSTAEMGSRKRWLASFALAGLAALMCGLAVLLLIGHNWQAIIAGWEGMPQVLKLAAILLAVVTSHGLAVHLRVRTPWQRGSEVAFFFACFMYGAAIWLIAQVFHVDAHWPDGIWWWALGVLPVALCMDTLLVHVLLAALVGMWASSEVLGFPHMGSFWHLLPNGAYSLLLFAGLGLAWSYRKGSAWAVTLYTALVSWWIFLQAFGWGGFFWGREEYGVYFIAITAPLLLIVGENHREHRTLARPWLFFGTLLTVGALVPLSFHDFHWDRYYGDRWVWHSPAYGFGGLLAVVLLLAAAIALLTLLEPWTEEQRRRGRFTRLTDLVRRQWMPLCLCGASVLMAFWDIAAFGTEMWGTTIIANVAMVAFAIWLMHIGLRDEQGALFAGGVVYFVLWSILRYVDLFGEEGGMLGAAAMFFLCGLMLFGLSLVWRRRKELHHVG